ncbi:unnamed protein product [Ascophyllum nodosum]
MGEDLVLPVSGKETVVEIEEVIKAIKGVPVTRMVAFKGEDDFRISDEQMTRSLIQNRLFSGNILLIRPTRPNQWRWHPLEWYEERLLQTVESVVRSNIRTSLARGCPLSLLQEKIAVPPPLQRDSLRAIIRRFPDRLRLDLDVVSQRFTVFPNKEEMLPPSSH